MPHATFRVHSTIKDVNEKYSNMRDNFETNQLPLPRLHPRLYCASRYRAPSSVQCENISLVYTNHNNAGVYVSIYTVCIRVSVCVYIFNITSYFINGFPQFKQITLLLHRASRRFKTNLI